MKGVQYKSPEENRGTIFYVALPIKGILKNLIK